MPVKVLDATGSGYLSDAALGIVWAVEQGADIVNLSLSSTSQLHAIDVAIEATEAAGVVVVASAGNAATSAPHWPAAHPLALSVAAVDGGTRAAYSNHGAWVDLAAPGCNPANKVGAGIRDFCGTSSSAPLTAGVAALVRAVDPSLNAPDVRAALTSTADPLAGGLGAGRINADAAVGSAVIVPQDPSEPAPAPPPAAPTPVEFGDIAGNVHGENIVRLATAGITTGCAADAFCPARTVNRGQMASFLVRALRL